MPTFIKTGLWENSTTAQVPKGWLNLTKLIKDNSGGVTENSNDYSIDERQVGYFIYFNSQNEKVRKPKYRVTVYSYLNTKEIDDITLSGADNISIPYIEQILFIQSNYNIEGKQVGFGESNFFKDYAAPHRTVNERINIGYYLYDNKIIIYGYMKSIDPENILPDTEIALPDGIEGIITLEYTKITDAETIIKPAV